MPRPHKEKEGATVSRITYCVTTNDRFNLAFMNVFCQVNSFRSGFLEKAGNGGRTTAVTSPDCQKPASDKAESQVLVGSRHLVRVSRASCATDIF